MTGEKSEQNCHRGAEGEEGADCALSVAPDHVIALLMATHWKTWTALFGRQER